MGFLNLDLSSSTELGIALATLLLAFVTALTIGQMRLQQKIDRSHKEMTLLVGQLHSHQESDFLIGINSTTYTPLPDRDRASADNSDWKEYYNFWDNIKINMYLGDSDLLSILQNYFAAKNDYWIWAKNGGHLFDTDYNAFERRIDRIKTMRRALRLETNRQYEILEGEINRLEHQPLWQFWK
jgi:hypothetical protein